MQPSVIDLTKRAGLTVMTLAGKTAVVTGAGSGIGREAACALAASGARVVIAELNDTTGRETQALIAETGGTSIFIRTDVSDEASVRAMFAQTEAAFGPVDILINNAILCPFAPVMDMDIDLWDRVMAVNLRGAFLTCKACLPGMLAAEQGVIVNMISVDAMPGLSAYITTKKGLAGFGQSLALEVGDQGVRVIAFAPGMVDTPGIRGVAPALAQQLGLTEQQFLSVPLHQAFEGLMPAEYAGAATAYLVAKLAEEYHGEMVNGYEVLERAGLIQPVNLPDPEGMVAAQPAASASRLPDLAYELSCVLTETEAEFKQLPAFVRPLARNGFKSKTGASFSDWQRLLTGLAGGQPPAADLPNRLEKLAGYFRDVPKETARFTKDAEVLRQVTATSQERQAVIQALKLAVEDR